MKPHNHQIGLILLILLVLFAVCSIPVSAAAESGTIPDTSFKWTIDAADKILDISVIDESNVNLDLTPEIISNISFTTLPKSEILYVSIAKQVPRIAPDTFKEFTSLKELYFRNADADISPAAFSTGKVYKLTTSDEIVNLYTAWAFPGEEVGVIFSSVATEGTTGQTILKVDSAKPVSIYVDESGLVPIYQFLMPDNNVHLSLTRNQEAGPDSAGTSVTFMTCKVTVTAEPGITFTVSARKYAKDTNEVEIVQIPVENGVATASLIYDEQIFVTVTSYPADHLLSAVTRGVDKGQWSGTTYTIESYNPDADDGNVKIHIVSIAPYRPGSSRNSGGSMWIHETFTDSLIEGILVEGSDNNKYTATDITNLYPGVYNAADIAININAAAIAAALGPDALKTYLLSVNPDLPGNTADEITTILMNAYRKGILHDTGSRFSPLVTISSGPMKRVEFYRVYDIIPEAGEETLRKIFFKVPLNDLRSAGYTENDVIMYHGYPDDKIWMPLETTFTSVDETYAHYTAITNGATPFAIVFAKEETPQISLPPESRNILIIVIIGLVVVLAGIITALIIRKCRKEKS